MSGLYIPINRYGHPNYSKTRTLSLVLFVLAFVVSFNSEAGSKVKDKDRAAPTSEQAIQALDCDSAYPSTSSVWPPNHKFQNIEIVGVSGSGEKNIEVLCIRQDEQLNSTGDGNTEYDGAGVGTASASIRRERKGNANGRMYHISFSAANSTGASCTGTVQVGVPKSKNKPAIDEGPLYASTPNNQTNCDGASNQPPVADPQSLTTNEDTSTLVTLTGTDADGDDLSFSISSNPGNGVLSGTVPNLFYTPSPNFNGTDELTFQVSDNAQNSVPAVVSISVLPINDLPTVQAQSLTTAEDTALPIVLAGSDADDDILSFEVTAQPSLGALSGTGSNRIYVPHDGVTGTDSFVYRVFDGIGYSDSVSVAIQVTPVNDAPLAENVNATTDEDIAVAIRLLATDVDSDEITYSITLDPSSGTLSGAAPDLTYTPLDGFSGTDFFQYSASDGELNSTVAEVRIIVVPAPNNPPAAFAGVDQEVTLGDLIALDGSASSDPDDDALSYAWEIIAAPIGANANIDNTLRVQTQLITDTAGEYQIQLTVNDGQLDSAPDVVLVTVSAINNPPVANAGPDQTVTLGDTVTLSGIGTDVDGDELTYQWTFVDSPNASATAGPFSTEQVTTFLPDIDGSFLIELVVSDGSTSSPADQLFVIVEQGSDNSAPEALPGSRTMRPGGTIEFTLAGEDVDGDPLTYNILSSPAGGVLTKIAEPSTYRFQDIDPQPQNFETSGVTFTVNDGRVDSDPAVFGITTLNRIPIVTTYVFPYPTVLKGNGELQYIDINGYDPDGDEIVWDFTTLPSYATIGEVQLAILHREQRLELFDQRVLGLFEHLHQALYAEWLEVADDGQATHQLGDQTELHHIFDLNLGNQLSVGLFVQTASTISKTQRLVTEPITNDLFDADERSANDEQDVAGVQLNVLLLGMFTSALRWNIGNGAFEHLEQALLDTFTGDVTGDRNIAAGLADLVHLVDVQDSALGRFDIKVSRVQQFEQQVLDVFTDVTCFGQCGRIADGKGNVQHPSE